MPSPWSHVPLEKNGRYSLLGSNLDSNVYEAKYKTIAGAAEETIWLKRVLQELAAITTDKTLQL